MIIDCISDLYGYYPILKGGDLLILTGDYTAADKIPQWCDFFYWLKKQDYKKKILIAGNHDNTMNSGWPKNQKEADDLKEVQEFLDDGEPDFEYLCDSGTEFEGLKIWGSPWSLWFKGINPKCKAFTGSENDLSKKYKLIPEDIDILITHTPPFGILDGIPIEDGSLYHAGSKSLADKLLNLNKLKFHLFGHIHEAYGQCNQAYSTIDPWDENPVLLGHLSINASYVNEKYQPVNKPIRIIL